MHQINDPSDLDQYRRRQLVRQPAMDGSGYQPDTPRKTSRRLQPTPKIKRRIERKGGN